MAVISSLSILLKARTDKFKRDMTSAVADLKKLGTNVKLITGLLLGMGAAMLGVSAFRMKDMFAQVQKDADRVGKLSDEIGTTVNEMMGMEHAAQITGTSVETMTRGLQRMNRRIGEASLGYGEGAKGLEQLGLKTEDLLGLGAHKQVKLIADQVNKMGSAGEKSAAIYSLFGRQGQNLLNFFALGSTGIQDLTDESEKLVGVYGREEFRIFENLNDAALRLGTALKGTILKISSLIATRLGAALTFLTDLLVNIREKHIKSLTDVLQRLIDAGLDGFARWAPLFVSIGQVILSTFKLIGDALSAMLNGFGMITQFVSGLIGSLAWWWNASTGINEELDDTESIMSTLHKGFTGIAVIVSRLPSMLGLLRDALINVSVYLANQGVFAWEKFGAKANFALQKIASGLALTGDLATKFLSGNFVGMVKALEDDRRLVEAIAIEYDATMTDIENRSASALTLGEINSATGLLDNLQAEYDALLDGFERSSRQKGGISAKLQAFIDNLKNFKFPDPPMIQAAKGLEVAAEKLAKFGQANVFGSQGAASALAANNGARPAKVAVAAVKKGAEDKEVIDLHKEEIKLLAQLNRRPPVTIETVAF